MQQPRAARAVAWPIGAPPKLVAVCATHEIFSRSAAGSAAAAAAAATAASAADSAGALGAARRRLLAAARLGARAALLVAAARGGQRRAAAAVRAHDVVRRARAVGVDGLRRVGQPADAAARAVDDKLEAEAAHAARDEPSARALGRQPQLRAERAARRLGRHRHARARPAVPLAAHVHAARRAAPAQPDARERRRGRRRERCAVQDDQ